MGRTISGYCEADTSTVSTFKIQLGQSGVSQTLDGHFVQGITGTYSHLTVSADNLGTGRLLTFQKNGSNGNQQVTLTNTTAGVYQDSAHFDNVSPIGNGGTADFICLLCASSVPSKFYWANSIFQAASGHACGYAAGTLITRSAANTDRYYQPVGRGNDQTNEANVKLRAETTGPLTYMHLYCQANARTSNSTLKTRIGVAAGSMVDGSCSITITALTPGLYIDTSGSQAISAGDDWDIDLLTGSGTNNFLPTLIGCWISTTSGAQNDIFSNQESDTPETRSAGASATYYPIVGQITKTSTEVNYGFQHGFPVRTSKARIYISANNYTGNATFRVRKNQGNGTQTATITAALPNTLFEDSSGTDDFGSTDACNYSISGGTANSITIQWFGLTETDLSPAPGPLVVNQAVKRASSF